jgi:hypothetical protein
MPGLYIAFDRFEQTQSSCETSLMVSACYRFFFFAKMSFQLSL